MLTNLALDDALLVQARLLSGHSSKKDAANTALKSYVEGLQKRHALLELLGTFKFDPAYDYKAARR